MDEFREMKRTHNLRAVFWMMVVLWLLIVMLPLYGCGGSSSEPEVPDCESLNAVFDKADCETEGCWNWVECNCSGRSFTWFACSPSEGCLSGLDCRAACALGRLGAQECVSSSYCVGDQQCDDGQVCVSPSEFYGICSSGDVGLPCFENGDCGNEYCRLEGQVIGTCTDLGGTGDPCDEDKGCQSGICIEVRLEEETSQVCSSGQLGDQCEDDGDCREGECYFPVGNGGFCRDGLPPGAECEADSACITELCVTVQLESGFTQICTQGLLGEQCGSDEDCLQGACHLYIESYGIIMVCTEEETPCTSDDQCASGFCNIWGSLEEGACTDGNEGDPCFDDGDCWSGICIHYEDDSGWRFECMDGSSGDPCSNHDDCLSSNCIMEIQATGVVYYCE